MFEIKSEETRGKRHNDENVGFTLGPHTTAVALLSALPLPANPLPANLVSAAGQTQFLFLKQCLGVFSY